MTSEERREMNRESILTAADRLFAENGTKGTTISQIAGAAGVVSKTVLNIFGSKSNLIFSVTARCAEHALQNAEALSRAPAYRKSSGLEQALQMIKLRISFFRKKAYIIKLMYEAEELAGAEEIEDSLVKKYFGLQEQMAGILQAALTRGIADGSIRNTLDLPLSGMMLEFTFLAFAMRLAQIQPNREYRKHYDLQALLEREYNEVRHYLTH